MALIKKCDKCGKMKAERAVLPNEKCKYCGGNMVIKAEQKTNLGWKSARQ